MLEELNEKILKLENKLKKLKDKRDKIKNGCPGNKKGHKFEFIRNYGFYTGHGTYKAECKHCGLVKEC